MDILTTAEVAAQLGVTPRRVQAMVKAGRLTPSLVLGRTFGFTAADVAAIGERRAGWKLGRKRKRKKGGAK
jgi:excisionase family DNA binding protein